MIYTHIYLVVNKYMSQLNKKDAVLIVLIIFKMLNSKY